MAKILVVDDEIGIRGLLAEILADEGHETVLAENAQKAREALQKEKNRLMVKNLAHGTTSGGLLDKIFDLVLLDIWMPDTDGVTLLKEWARDGELIMPVIMMSGHGTISNAMEATKIGASGFLEKPLTISKLLTTIKQALARIKSPHTQIQANSTVAPSSLLSDSTKTMAVANTTDHHSKSMSIEARYAERLVEEVPFNMPLRDARDVFEKIYFQYHLERENGSMTRVAGCTGLERTHLYRKIRYLGVELTRKRSDG